MTEQIVCIGAGYVGGPSMAVMADRCPGIDIKVVDIDQRRIDRWNNLDNSDLPVYEPGLEEVIKRVRGKNLTFTTDLKGCIENADMVFLSVNTPTKNYGYGAGQAADLSYIEGAARQIAEYGKGQTIVVERSTLPVRTAEALQTILKQGNGESYKILSNPEFMAEGTAIADLQKPDRVLVGGQCSESVEELASIYRNWVPNDRILRTNVWSAELSKLTANAFLAQRISSINSIAALCEKSGANIKEVKQAIGADTRIGSFFLNPGPGFGGSCFKKDILNLAYLADHFGLMEVANYWRSILELNEWTQHRIAHIISQKFFGTLRGKKIAVLGFAFKANTNDTRESPAIELCAKLIQEGANLFIHDPKVSEDEIKRELRNNEHNRSVGSYQYERELNRAVEDAHAVVLMTDWDEYRRLDWSSLANRMKRPAWVFDTRGITNLREAAANGLETWEVGCGGHQ
jgi:UDPglucose 6-dehydrogenase